MFVRNISFAVLLMCFSVMAIFGQRSSEATMPNHGHGMMHIRGTPSDQQIDNALDTLQRTLNLNTNQVTSIRRLAQSRRDTMKSVREQARPKFEQLMTLLKQDNPDPASVGRAAIELKRIHDQAESKNRDFEKQLSSLFNPSQKQTVDNLRSQAQTFDALRTIGFIAPRHRFMSGTTESVR